MEKIHAIVNPAVDAGSVARNWTSIRSLIHGEFGEFTSVFINHSGDAREAAKSACRDRVNLLLVVGDGETLTKIVNGLLQSHENPDCDELPTIAFIGPDADDFSRSLHLSGSLETILKKVKNGTSHPADIGSLTYTSFDQKQESAYFINHVGCGFTGEVVQSIKESPDLLTPATYLFTSTLRSLTYVNPIVKFRFDNELWLERKITAFVISNGRYSYRGMNLAPNADPSDGLFDVTILGNFNMFEKFYHIQSIYSGGIARQRGVETFRAKKIELLPVHPDKLLFDCDGETLGHAPFTVEMISHRLNFRY